MLKARGLGGVIWEFDYPLKSEIELQIKNGMLKVIERTGEDARPDVIASREAWIKYLDDVHDIDPNSLKGMSKTELIKEASRLDKESGRGS